MPAPRARRRVVALLVAIVAGILASLPIDPAVAVEPAVPAPVLTAPPAGLRGFALWDSYSELGPFGYEEQEYLVSGTAVDAAGAPAPYTTRMIVTRPTDPAAFNGTVLLDWVNVTAQFENSVTSIEARPMLMREGFAFVHVSLQSAGLCCIPLTPKVWDPVRYAAVSHPGDAWSFDMLSQIAQSFRNPVAAPSLDPMGGLGAGSVRSVLAAGQSQSAIRLREYLDHWLPAHADAVGLIDGFLIHGDVGAEKGFRQPLPVKVLNLLSDFEASADGFDPATADPNYRLWEVAGTGHSDFWIGHQSVVGHGPRVLAALPKQTPDQLNATLLAAGNYGERIDPELLACVVAGSTMPMHYSVSSALHQLAGWVGDGPSPVSGPRFAFNPDGTQAKDGFGNPLGGIRLPPNDVPVATYQSTVCALGGITVPFTDGQLLQLYGSHAEYERRMGVATDRAVSEGWILPEDAVDLMQRVCAARIRFPATAAPCAPYDPPEYFTVRAGTEPTAAEVTTTTADAGRGMLPATGGSPPVLLALAAALGALALRRLSAARS
jgi:hypothetical protein